MVDDARPEVSLDYPEALARSIEQPTGIRKLRDVYVTMRDGVKLCVDIGYNNPLRQIDVHLLPWPVENAVHHSGDHPSRLLLAVIRDAPYTVPVGPPLSEIEWPLLPGCWSPNTDGWPLVDDQ